MARYTVEPTAPNVRDTFSRDYPPILEVEPGDTVVVRTLDARWNLERYVRPGIPVRTLEHTELGHCLCGPILVRGAEPGKVLAVHMQALTPGSWGWTEAGSKPPLNRLLGVGQGVPTSLLWEIDLSRRVATDQAGHAVDVAPFLGVIGLAPDEPGKHSTIPPRLCGGNIDCKELVVGSTLYLPVACKGGLLSVGDGHAAQGDGELSESAIECPMTSELGIDLREGGTVPAPCAVTPNGLITFGFDPNLNEAMVRAADSMLRWMESLLAVDRGTALALASVIVDLRITQVVNQRWGVHAVLSTAALRNLGLEAHDGRDELRQTESDRHNQFEER
jgi:acetamidase/formamidase